MHFFKKYFIFFKTHFFYAQLNIASKSKKLFFTKKIARAITFETLLHAKKWFFKNIFWKLFLKSARSADLRPELPPIKPEKITFLNFRCSSSRQFIFSLLRVFSKKIIFFKKIFHFFQKCKNGYFEIFFKNNFQKYFFSFFRIIYLPLPRRVFKFWKKYFKKTFLNALLRKYF